MAKQQKTSIGVLLLQMLVSALVLLTFSTYLWLIQLTYDDLETGYKRALFYALVVFGAGFSYDCAKRILFLPQTQFVQFGRHLIAAVFHFVFIVVLVVASGVLMHLGATFPGQLAYIAALGWLWFLLSSSTQALEIASKDAA